MKYLAMILTPALLAAQTQSSQSTTYTYDINGRLVPVATSSSTKTNGSASSTQVTPSPNGGPVTNQQVEEHVIAQGPQGKIVERIVRLFDQNGRPSGVEKSVINEQKNADGSTTTQTTVYDSSINGGFQVRERSTKQTVTHGNTVKSDTTIERPTPNGGFDMTEKRVSVKQGDDKQNRVDLAVFLKDANGVFTQATREVTQTNTAGNQTTTNTTEYRAQPSGQLQFSGQKVTTATQQPNGGLVEVTDVYTDAATGQANSNKREPHLWEQRIIERKPSAGGQGFVETLSIRRTAPDSARLGAPVRISETVCQGTCIAPTPPAAAPAPAQPAGP
jgi:hypothetical protein